MKAALDKAGVENKLTVFPGADHDFYVKGDPAKTDAYALEAMNAMVAWFEAAPEIGARSARGPRAPVIRARHLSRVPLSASLAVDCDVRTVWPSSQR